MVNINDNNIIDKNNIEFDEINSKYIYPDSPQLNFADDEGGDDSPLPTIQEENEDGESEVAAGSTAKNLNNSVNNNERNANTEANSRIHQKKKRRHLRENELETAKSKRLRREGYSDAGTSTTDISTHESNFASNSPTVNFLESDPFSSSSYDDNGCFKNMFKAYNKLFSSPKYQNLCPYKSLEDIDKNIQIKPKSALTLLFPINAFFDTKITKYKQLSWETDNIQRLQILKSPIEDKLLSEAIEAGDVKFDNIFDESAEPPKSIQISEDLMPKTKYEKNYWKNLMPKIGYNFIIQPGICKIEKEKWLRLKEIDDLNEIEWTEMDIGYDLIKKDNS
uniref:Uncharacterized protein n=1 Tax=Panagrolaimus davidi TaxID=227884 RepID=A0A914PEC3_9BILA